MKFLLILFLTVFSYKIFAQDEKYYSISAAPDTSTIARRMWLHTEENERAFFNKLIEFKYEEYKYDPDNFRFGEYLFYVSEDFLTKTSAMFENIGLPPLNESLVFPNYRGYLIYLRNFIDSDAYLHSDEEFAYGLTNERGLSLMSLEMYYHELVVAHNVVILDSIECQEFSKVYKLFKSWLVSEFTEIYDIGAVCQMSGLTGDTCRYLWPSFRLMNIIIYELTRRQEYEIAFKFMSHVTESISLNGLYDETLHDIRDIAMKAWNKIMEGNEG